MKNSTTLPRTLALLCAAGLAATSAHALDRLEYALPEGQVRVVEVKRVSKADLDDLSVRALINGRPRPLRLKTRYIVSFRRGSQGDVNQWAKKLATAYGMMASGQLATVEKVPGAEEVLTRIVFAEVKMTPDPEREQILPWHRKYGLYALIEVRRRLGTEKGINKKKLETALEDIKQFEARSSKRAGAKIKWKVPGETGISEKNVQTWGETWLWPRVLLQRARIEAALGDTAKAKKTYDEVIKLAEEKELSPYLITTSVMEIADLDAAGKGTEQAEQVYRAAGNRLRNAVRRQPDDFGKGVVRQSANRALLKGADLLLKSAEEKKVSYDVPLRRYRQLAGTEGRNDAAMLAGARTGVGICLVEQARAKKGTGKGREAYEALLWVANHGFRYAASADRALYYLGVAAPLFADEVDAKGGSGDYLRKAGARWWADLKSRFPDSPWTKKAK